MHVAGVELRLNGFAGSRSWRRRRRSLRGNSWQGHCSGVRSRRDGATGVLETRLLAPLVETTFALEPAALRTVHVLVGLLSAATVTVLLLLLVLMVIDVVGIVGGVMLSVMGVSSMRAGAAVLVMVVVQSSTSQHATTTAATGTAMTRVAGAPSR